MRALFIGNVSALLVRLVCFVLIFASTSAMAINPKVGIWWNPQESGRGYILDGSGTTLAMQAYTYESTGQPLWYLAVGQLTNGGANWSATLEKYSGGQCFGCSFKQNQSAGNDGVVTIQFTSDTTGVMTMPNGLKTNIVSFFPAGTTPSGGVVTGGLAALYGTLNLSYKFSLFSTVYNESATFSAASLSSNGQGLVAPILGSNSRAISCLIASASISKMYFCVIYDGVYGSSELFTFDINSGQIKNGVYTYCSASLTTSDCASKSVMAPSGTVSGNLVKLASGLQIISNGYGYQNDNDSKYLAEAQSDGGRVRQQEFTDQQKQQIRDSAQLIDSLR